MQEAADDAKPPQQEQKGEDQVEVNASLGLEKVFSALGIPVAVPPPTPLFFESYSLGAAYAPMLSSMSAVLLFCAGLRVCRLHPDVYALK